MTHRNDKRKNALIATSPIGVIAALALGSAAYSMTPAPQDEMEHVEMLSKMGPRAHAAFEDAIANGTITRNEMRIMRREAVRDLQVQEAKSKS